MCKCGSYINLCFDSSGNQGWRQDFFSGGGGKPNFFKSLRSNKKFSGKLSWNVIEVS